MLCAALLPVDVAVAVVAEAGNDSWGVRLSGQRLETLSDVNIGKPVRGTPLQSRPVAARSRGAVALELRADAATTARLQAVAGAYAPELDKAMEWLQRLRPGAQPPARIVLTLVEPQWQLRERRVHDTGRQTVVDLVVPLPTAPASPSVGVGKALAVALHEMSHAFSAGARDGTKLSRREDEYRAALVESCYLIDTLRVGDVLRLAPRQGAATGEHFVAAYSRDAARSVVADLVRAAGTDTVRWDDNIALLGLELACAVRLAHTP